MDLKLTNKVAIVLAASKGLGRAIATTLSAEGAKVIIGSRNVAELNKTAAEIQQQTGNEASLNRFPLLVQGALGLEGTVKTVVPIDDQKGGYKKYQVPGMNRKFAPGPRRWVPVKPLRWG